MITLSKDFWEAFKSTNGALSCAESVAIANIAAQAPEGVFCECGTHLGKSAMSAILTLKKGYFYLLDPEFKDEEFRRKAALSILTVLSDNKEVRVQFIPEYSTDFLQDNKEMFSYVFVDSGSHQDGLPMQEVKILEDRMVQGGIIAFHDWNSQFSEVKEASDYLVSTGKYEYIPIDWNEINAYVDENNLNEGNVSWHHTELTNPNFVGAVKRK